MAEIPLTQNKTAIIDDCDLIEIGKHKWCAGCYDGKWYAVRGTYNNGVKRNVFMHRQLTSAIKGQQVDHKDGNGLNNSRDNLRFSTQQQNVFNQRPTGKGTSKYKGVSWDKSSNSWYSAIKFNGKSRNLGHYKNETDAAIAYDSAAIKFFGEFARPNISQRVQVIYG